MKLSKKLLWLTPAVAVIPLVATVSCGITPDVTENVISQITTTLTSANQTELAANLTTNQKATKATVSTAWTGIGTVEKTEAGSTDATVKSKLETFLSNYALWAVVNPDKFVLQTETGTDNVTSFNLISNANTSALDYHTVTSHDEITTLDPNTFKNVFADDEVGTTAHDHSDEEDLNSGSSQVLSTYYSFEGGLIFSVDYVYSAGKVTNVRLNRAVYKFDKTIAIQEFTNFIHAVNEHEENEETLKSALVKAYGTPTVYYITGITE